ncbi:hypothetical protein ILUMI_15454, partial [Ignelater luminosus]
DIISIDRNTRYNQDKAVTLIHEEKSLTKGLEEEDAHIDNLKEVLDNVNKLTDPSQGLSLGQFAQMFRELQ